MRMWFVLCASLTSRTCMERFQDDINDPLARQHVPAAYRSRAGRGQQRFLWDLDFTSKSCHGPGEGGQKRVRTFKRNQTSCIKRDIHVKHTPHAINHRRMDNSNRRVKVPADLTSRPGEVKHSGPSVLVNVDAQTNLAGLSGRKLMRGAERNTRAIHHQGSPWLRGANRLCERHLGGGCELRIRRWHECGTCILGPSPAHSPRRLSDTVLMIEGHSSMTYALYSLA